MVTWFGRCMLYRAPRCPLPRGRVLSKRVSVGATSRHSLPSRRRTAPASRDAGPPSLSIRVELERLRTGGEHGRRAARHPPHAFAG